MKNKLITSGFLLFCFVILLSVNCKEKTDVYEDYSWITEIRDDHPRLFFNQNSFQEIKERALNEENDLFEEMKNRMDALVGQKVEFKDSLERDGTQNNNHKYGTRAAESAFIYLVNNEKKYFTLTKRLLTRLVDYYQLRNEHNLNIHWYAFSRINALAAYDWIYNDLTEKERREIGSPLLHAISYMPSEDRGSVFRRNTGDTTTGFYGPPCLPWYAGLVFYDEGIEDSLSKNLLIQGYDDHTGLLRHRSNIAGDDGGAASAALNYCMGAYPWAEYNFFHTFHSATGLDISKEWPYVPSFINYVFWNWLPDDRQFGYGDQPHVDNNIPTRLLHLHLSQMIHFYGDTQEELVARAKWMKTKVKRQPQDNFPFARFLLRQSYDEIKPEEPSESTPTARHFKNMGQVFMRSGSGADDSYAVFTAGGILTQHRHYDNNNFVIFKKGFVTLDTGTRPEPGLHLPYYFCRTIAHNCITIKMDGEKMPSYWGQPALNEQPAPPVPNDGGQRDKMGSEVIAFDEKESYAYIASDATDSYHQEKADLVLRQFVFLPPDHFVVFDRVNSTEPEYKKRWLFHAAKEPDMIEPNIFSTNHWDGRVICKTLYPENAQLTKIGGPGKQFWSDGRDWPLPELTPEDWNYPLNLPPDTHDLYGQWRIEVAPAEEKTDDLFLHLIQVGDKDSLESMVTSTLEKTGDMVGLRFAYKGKDYEVRFATKGEDGGEISIKENGRTILEEDFIEEVKKQRGIY